MKQFFNGFEIRYVFQLSSKENILIIDASDLPNAVYIIKAENEGDIKTKKIIK
ncbi:MAG: T9SS type A sorting domain-containing protein [Chryseobacterium sp.]|nr:T9SS type A sorting domain-containing protein [Chryseobacterium sp.]